MLTRESLRADIAAMIHEDPEEIGGDDNLIDLGLDSLRAMTLLVRWSETGLRLDFSEFAEQLTLDAWWAIVERQQKPAG
ncbi:phosphopantetheine-binding protein [Roseomonas marmotae]|uniref:Phosphopantetheine-binding protein n=1 Tax=Roseomonas marmotae TaxID=2768161 RepID=A0ABS3KAS7_9PROT|nr:phosphopantetheine-binding protein [Roseomonas marmotae]MBO1074558.1 phosphopantetheine-binding protein [Roseomonas marmotae]QTI81590.1 phosphopantetheine-binding protein [Roseomonas marmotae]